MSTQTAEKMEPDFNVADLGLAELCDGPGVTVIEWGDTIAAAIPSDYLDIRITLGDTDDDRRFEIRVVGPNWRPREVALATAWEAWAC